MVVYNYLFKKIHSSMVPTQEENNTDVTDDFFCSL